MKRAILVIALAVFAMASSVAGAEVCPDLQYIGQFQIAQDGAEVPRAAVGPDRKVYVADINGGFLKIYYSNGEFVQSRRIANIISAGVVGGTGGVVFIGTAHDGQDGYTGEVGVYDMSLQYQFSLGAGAGEFQYPASIVSDGQRVFVADKLADLVKVYSLINGDFLFSFGGSGSAESDIPRPSDLALHPVTGDVYVSDSALDYDSRYRIWGYGAGVHVFNGIDGSFLMKYPITYGFENLPGQMQVASGITIDELGRVYVTDAGQGTVEVYDDAGNYICEVASTSGTVYQHTPGFTSDGRFVFASVGGLFSYTSGQYVDMAATPSSLDFVIQDCANAPLEQAVTLSNNGVGTMNWTASTDAAWLLVDKVSGVINGAGTSEILVSVDGAALSSGSYPGNVTFTSEAGTVIVGVTLVVSGPPSLEVSDVSAPYSFLVHGGNAAAFKSLMVNIAGDLTGEVRWSASAGAQWVTITPSSGPSGVEALVSIGIDFYALGGLASGSYATDVVVSAGCASIMDVSVPVTLEYHEGGAIEVSTNLPAAGFSITGPQEFAGSGESSVFYEAAAGEYTITFSPVAGYRQPGTYSLTLPEGGVIAFEGMYEDLRQRNEIIATMGGTNSYSVDDEAVVFDGDGIAVGSFIISQTKHRLTEGETKGFPGGSVAASGDLDGDGVDEVAVATVDGVITLYQRSGGSASGVMSDEPQGKSAKAFMQSDESYMVAVARFTAFRGTMQVDLAMGDLDGDGLDEVIVGSGKNEENGPATGAMVRAFRYVDGEVVDTGLYFRANEGNEGVNISAGDIDGDGTDELLTTRAGTGNRLVVVRVWKIVTTSGVWSVEPHTELEAGMSHEAADIAAGDIDSDGVDEVLVTRLPGSSDSASMVTAFEADATMALDFSVPATGIVIAVGDIDFDGYAEVVVGRGSSRTSSTVISIYNHDGTYRGEFEAFSDSQIFGAMVTLGRTAGR